MWDLNKIPMTFTEQQLWLEAMEAYLSKYLKQYPTIEQPPGSEGQHTISHQVRAFWQAVHKQLNIRYAKQVRDAKEKAR